MKQIQGFGPGGETIMDYSIYDAARAGFKKVIFIIREEFAEDFKEIFEPKLKGRIETGYVYQDLRSFAGDFEVPADRTKPWGTAHAVLCAKDSINGPFAVINADDFYGAQNPSHSTSPMPISVGHKAIRPPTVCRRRWYPAPLLNWGGIQRGQNLADFANPPASCRRKYAAACAQSRPSHL